MRELAARSLAQLTRLDAELMRREALPRLFVRFAPAAASSARPAGRPVDAFSQHGALLAIGELFLALSRSPALSAAELFTPEHVLSIKHIFRMVLFHLLFLSLIGTRTHQLIHSFNTISLH